MSMQRLKGKENEVGTIPQYNSHTTAAGPSEVFYRNSYFQPGWTLQAAGFRHMQLEHVSQEAELHMLE